jgi:hypothetical protein
LHAYLGAFLHVLHDFGIVFEKNTLEERASNVQQIVVAHGTNGGISTTSKVAINHSIL